MVRQLRGKIIVVFLIGSLFVATPTPKAWAIFGSTSSIINAWDSLRTALQSAWQSAKQYDWVIQDLQSADRTLVAMEDMYYMVQAFSYLHDNGGILGAVNYMSQATSMATGMAQLGLSAYQDTTSSFAPSMAMSPQNYSNALGDLSIISSTSGALASSAQTLSMISNENSGVPFLEVVNGAQLGVQAALTTTQAVDNLQSFMAQREQEKTLHDQALRISAEENYLTRQPQLLTVPCDNMPAYATTFATSSEIAANGTICTTLGAPGLNPIVTTGTGINRSIAIADQQMCEQSIPNIVKSGQSPPNCTPPMPTPSFNPENPSVGGGQSLGFSAPTIGLNPTIPSYSFGGGP